MSTNKLVSSTLCVSALLFYDDDDDDDYHYCYYRLRYMPFRDEYYDSRWQSSKRALGSLSFIGPFNANMKCKFFFSLKMAHKYTHKTMPFTAQWKLPFYRHEMKIGRSEKRPRQSTQSVLKLRVYILMATMKWCRMTLSRIKGKENPSSQDRGPLRVNEINMTRKS